MNLHENESEHLHVHNMMMNGPKGNESDILHLSIPLCHNESSCTKGNKTSSQCINMLKQKARYVMLQVIRVETLLLIWGTLFYRHTWYSHVISDHLDFWTQLKLVQLYDLVNNRTIACASLKVWHYNFALKRSSASLWQCSFCINAPWNIFKNP